MGTILYFAYGSNMDQHRMSARGVKFSKSEKAEVKGYKITFNKQAHGKKGVGYTNITKDKRRTVEGVLYTISEGLKNLDDCEAFPDHYDKEFFWVTVKRKGKEEKEKSVVYIACKDKIKKGLKPEKGYIYHLIEGAKQHDLSQDYIKILEETETYD